MIDVDLNYATQYIVASELKDPICHSDECQIGSFSSEATILYVDTGSPPFTLKTILKQISYPR